MSLDGLTDRAESVAKRLELLVASMHDLPDAGAPPAKPQPAPEAQPDSPLGPMFKRHDNIDSGAA